MRIGIVSDTHGHLPSDAFEHLEGVERILHAGDIGRLDILTELEAVAPVTAVWGNTDDSVVRAATEEVARRVWSGRTIVVLHGHQLGMPTAESVAARHPEADLVAFGHTHEPVIRRVGRVLAVNPGSLGAPRGNARPTLVLAHLDGDEIRAELISLGTRR